MAFACASILAFSIAGCWLTSVQIPSLASILLVPIVMIAGVLPLPAHWHEKGEKNLRDAALTIPWGLLLMVALPCMVGVAGRLGRNIDLRDTSFVQLDQSFGVSVAEISKWASHHWIGSLINATYPLLFPLLLAAFLLPALTGKVAHAQQFLTANLAAFAMGMPLFALFPAVGPWYGYRLLVNGGQAACQQSILLLRAPGYHNWQPFGIVCFPSFHVIWALLSVNALWCFKPLRIPVCILAASILLSTMTTAWHYFVDVLAGCLVAAAAIATARLSGQVYAECHPSGFPPGKGCQ
jgi:membrane-associated phospholipid phosphatase